ncbi:MAG: Rnf-Nqr domain containing protein, partial [Christensenellales bacterium]
MISAVFINNFVLSQFLGICPFIGVSKKTDTALGMGLAVIFVMGIASVITYCLNTYILVPLGLD